MSLVGLVIGALVRAMSDIARFSIIPIRFGALRLFEVRGHDHFCVMHLAQVLIYRPTVSFYSQ